MAKTIEKKMLVFIIEYKLPAEDAGGIEEVMEKMRETGEAAVVDVRVEPYKV